MNDQAEHGGGTFETKVTETYKRMLKLPLVANALARLESGLSEQLCFHSSSHTKNVIEEAVRFCLFDGVDEKEIELVAIAAAFHDAGFLESPMDNERIGARIARDEVIKHGGYTEEQATLIESMILDTRLLETESGPKQIPGSRLARYLLDADLSNLGRSDFFERSELLRRELGVEQSLFFHQTKKLLGNHQWLTNAAMELRKEGQEANYQKLIKVIKEMDPSSSSDESSAEGLSLDRLLFLARLPLLLNSSLRTEKIMNIALEHLKSKIGVEAATVFLLDPSETQLTFWAMRGEQSGRLVGMKMPSGKGIVGWVIENQESVLIKNATNDPRFFSEIDKEGGFETRNLLCVPLTSRGSRNIGAIQALNKLGDEELNEEDLKFLEQFAHQMALAIDNARLYESLEEKNRKLAALDKRKNEMISVIGHEFRTPLNVIQTSSDLLSSGHLKEDGQKQMAQTLQNGVGRLTRLTSDILQLSLVSEGQVPLKKEKLEIGKFFKTLEESYGEPARARNIELSFDPHNPGEVISVDPSLLMVAIGNLLANAIRFTPDGGTIEVTSRCSSGLVEIEVKDSGIGIEEEELALIFDKFYEVGAAVQHSSGRFEFKSGGLGIGLATAQAILREHDASLNVQSKPGKGSSFSVQISV